jgi:biopolymer transport protein ExbB
LSSDNIKRIRARECRVQTRALLRIQISRAIREIGILRKLVVALLLVFCLPAISKAAWWNNDWNFRKEITFDLTPGGANVPGTPVDVPVLIRLHLGNFGYFNDTKPDGSDLRFIASDDKTPLKFHIERYDPVNQIAFLWVRIPRLAGGTNTEKIYLYYGNPKAAAAGDAPGTYDVSQTLVYHLSDAQLPPADSTANGNKASAANVELNAASLIGGGAKLTGTTSITTPSTPSLRLIPAQGATFSAWVRIPAAQNDALVLVLQDKGNELGLGINGTQAYARLIGPGGRAQALQTGQLDSEHWHHLAVTVGGGRLTLYVDGDASASVAAQPAEIAGTLTIGAAAGGAQGFNGEIDEVQVSNVARSPDWLRIAARSQGNEAPLVVYGNDTQRETQKVSYFKITLQNVTPDGWVVIIILALMFLISMLIIVSKALYLARVQRGNVGFLAEFVKLKGDPTALDRPDPVDGEDALDLSPFTRATGDQKNNKFRMSTIYHLYHSGIREMHSRVGESAGASVVRSLSPQAINALRAALDASQVRLTQKLSSQMVLLTIAIAGGPFLGLLGTVVGVMITFAAIAASGDVNVNSIAPGIAAALAATVAGLAVAIPALFGYNWLNTRIKNISADMRVFVDEFVTRIAEHYS